MQGDLERNEVLKILSPASSMFDSLIPLKETMQTVTVSPFFRL